MLPEVLSILAISTAVMLSVAIIYLYTKVFAMERDTNQKISEIKSKIGAIIRDINLINKLEYEVDMEQQSSINNMTKQMMTTAN